MGLESGNTVADLNQNWPLGSDPKSQGDDHLRLLKGVLKSDVFSKAADAANIAALIMHGDAAAGWWVIGDVLVCWGETTPTAGITFPRAFKTQPVVSIGQSQADSPRWVAVDNVTTTGATQRGWRADENSSNAYGGWIAIGEALDDDKRPSGLTP